MSGTLPLASLSLSASFYGPLATISYPGFDCGPFHHTILHGVVSGPRCGKVPCRGQDKRGKPRNVIFRDVPNLGKAIVVSCCWRPVGSLHFAGWGTGELHLPVPSTFMITVKPCIVNIRPVWPLKGDITTSRRTN